MHGIPSVEIPLTPILQNAPNRLAVEISALVGGRASSPVVRALFFVFRIKVCRSGTQVVVVAPRAIRSSRLQPHLGGNIEKLV
jgi:hypothetical protein